ncbi:bifunctional diguanylate cyclase/phosphodiesterase [Pseudoxanthomonas gei]|nr:EAL domain-containing protein [Pseudoxanthomonas gei]
MLAGLSPADDMPRRLGIPPAVWAMVVLVLGLLFTGWVARREWLDERASARASYSVAADASLVRLRAPLENAAQVLRAMQTVFLSNDHMDQPQFEQYSQNLRIPEAQPGYVATVFARRQPDPGDPQRVAYPYELAAPLQGNQSLIGFDIAAQQPNLLALQRARDADAPIISAPFALRQFKEYAGPAALGVTVRLPVYSRGAIPADVAERRSREIGALAISLRLQPLVYEALGSEAMERFQVRIRDADAPAAGSFFDSDPSFVNDATVQTRMLEFGGRRWQLQLRPRVAVAGTTRVRNLAIAGVTISLLLAALLWSLSTTRRRAVKLGQHMSERFRESETRFRTLNELLPALVLLADAGDGRIVYANQAARLRLGEATGMLLADVLADPALRQRADAASGRENWPSQDAALLDRDGKPFWVNASIAQVDMDGVPHRLMVATDISEQRELTERLIHQASHDALTELCNRREFEHRLELALADRKLHPDSRPCALLYIDLDQFKLINDVSGHMAGDQLLTQLALAMRQQQRAGDVLARLGGDEFGLLAFGVDAEGARRLAERLRECIEALMFSWESHTYTISASIGVVVVDHGEPTLKDLLAWADTACYLAKENGRNRVHVYREDNETTRRQSEMEWANRVRWAVEQDRLLLDYQEIVPLGAREEDAPTIELLLRMRDDQDGIVLPGTFLQAAERYGLMPAIDRWVIRNALAHFSELHPSGARLGTCAINLSGASIEDEGLADFILGLIAQYEIPAQKICFEITETVAVRNLLKVVQMIERLREAGCLIALDDFGAGMSSFGYLKNLPVDMIKIDGSFVRDLDTDPMSHTIISAITQIGHQRGLKVVAEWVSASHMSAALHALGVDYGQGFALHRPERVLYQRPESESHRAAGR